MHLLFLLKFGLNNGLAKTVFSWKNKKGSTRTEMHFDGVRYEVEPFICILLSNNFHEAMING